MQQAIFLTSFANYILIVYIVDKFLCIWYFVKHINKTEVVK